MRTSYGAVTVDGLSVFYREAGRRDAPTILLLHGFPSSSRMYEPLLARLADRYRLVAPDYPGFGHSDAPDATDFAYTFDRLAAVMIRPSPSSGPIAAICPTPKSIFSMPAISRSTRRRTK